MASRQPINRLRWRHYDDAIRWLCEAAGIDGTQIVADYVHCFGESMEWTLPRWADVDEVRRELRRLRVPAGGDLYARFRVGR